MKRIFLPFILAFSCFCARGQQTPFTSGIITGTTNKIIVGDGVIVPYSNSDALTLEAHATKLNVGQFNSNTYNTTYNTALFNCAAASDGKEIVRFRTNNNTGYFTMSETTLGTFTAQFVQSGAAQLFLRSNGNVGIGTNSPNSKLEVNGGNLLVTNTGKLYVGAYDASSISNMGTSLLGVNGTAVFVKAKVALYGSAWPDYVFSPGYKLPILDSLEQFILLNKHLPEVPTSGEVEKNGIDLGDNQALLLKKIEELTLITIEQNKRIDKLELLLRDRKK